MTGPRRIAQTPFLQIPVWVYEDIARDCSTLRVYLTILNRNLTGRSAPRRLDWLIEAAEVSRSTTYEALATLRTVGALVESDTEWRLPLDRPVSGRSDKVSGRSDKVSGRSDDATLVEGVLERAEDSSSDDDTVKDPDYGFDHFWSAWPRRNGKKLFKAKALTVWRRLSLDEKRAAWRGANHYADASGRGLAGAMDAFRWLRDRAWEDWQEPVRPDRKGSRGEPAAFGGMLRLVGEEWNG